MVELSDLWRSYRNARKNKSGSKDTIRYERHLEANLCKLKENIENRTLTPSSYSFIVTHPRPREVFACEMGFRIVHHYIDERMRPLMEARFTDRTFNNRIGYGPLKAIEKFKADVKEVTENFTKPATIVKVDIEGFFPNANRALVCECLSKIIRENYDGVDKEDLLYMIERSVLTSPTDNCERHSPTYMWKLIPEGRSVYEKPNGIGGAIGYLVWQNGMNFFLNDIDHWLMDVCHVRFVRFVDDIVMVDNDKEKLLRILPELRRRLAAIGCVMHRKKFYCQPYEHGVEFIGHHIKFNREYVSNRMLLRFHNKIHQFNKCAKPNKIKDFLASMNSYLGFMKNCNEWKMIHEEMRYINKKWWNYVEFNEERRCFVAKEGYKVNDLLMGKYGLKKSRYKKKNKRK